MNKTILLLLAVTVAFISCKDPKKEGGKLEIAKQYYQALDQSDHAAIATLLANSILTKETPYDYQQTFTLNEYIEWVKWDSVFDPAYKIIDIKQKDEMVEAKISKFDKRISFLHEEPMVIHQTIRFDNGKINSIETTEYEVFNESVFTENRGRLLKWIDENHPELNGFLNDQTQSGGMNYLKAIDLYENRQ